MTARSITIALLGVAWLQAPAPAQQIDARKALAVKAHYLTQFPKFVHWPESVLTDGDTPLVIGVIGDAEVVAAVKEAAGIQKGRSLTVRAFDPREGLDEVAVRQCHLLYVAGGDQDRLEDAIIAVAGDPILVVSDEDAAIKRGGMIGLVVHDGRIGFDVHLTAIESVGLKVDAKLLKLARVVDR